MQLSHGVAALLCLLPWSAVVLGCNTMCVGVECSRVGCSYTKPVGIGCSHVQPMQDFVCLTNIISTSAIRWIDC